MTGVQTCALPILGSSFLSNESVKKLDKNLFSINFDTCDLEDFPGNICGLIDITLKGNGEHVSRFEGKRTDRFKFGSGFQKVKFEGKSVEKSATVEGSLFGETLQRHLPAIFSYQNLSNV